MDNERAMREFESCLSSILSGKSSQEITEAWSKLTDLGLLEEVALLAKDPRVLRTILNRQVANLHEVPHLLTWFARYTDSDSFVGEPLSNDIAALLKNAGSCDMSLLTALTTVLLEHSVYLPMSQSHTRLCETIVVCLASLPMPFEARLISEFNDNAAKIQNFFMTLCTSAKNVDKDNLVIACLETLYRIISDPEKKCEPGPAMVVVLQLVEPMVIPQAVQWILTESRSDRQLVEALKTLCTWLPKWSRGDRLVLWVMAFMQGLEKERKYAVLIEVTEATLEAMFSSLILPVVRQNLSIIVFYILRRQNTPQLFHKIAKRVWRLWKFLSKDETESARECIQNIVDVITALMMRFPGYPFYEGVQNGMPVPARMDEVHKILREAVWAEEVEEPEPVSYRSNTGKVGLTNLGNTCYMNSVLQALFMTRQFCLEVLNFKGETAGESAEQVVLRKLQHLFTLLLYSKRISLAPTEILLASRPAYFMPGQQQDSSEFLCHLLDVLYEQEKSSSMHCGSGDPVTDAKSKDGEQMCEEIAVSSEAGGIIKRWTTEEDLTEGVALQRKTQSLADFTQGEESTQTQHLSDSHSDSTDSGIQSVGGEDSSTQSFLVHRVFGGESKITYQCAQCDTSSHNTDKFRDLQLCFPEEVPANREVSVQDLINYYLTPEKLTGENKYRCDKCTKLCDAHRIIKVLQAPTHLILTLKHFHYDSESRLRTKLKHKVKYNETVQLPVCIQSSVVTETYNLYAAVVHSGYSMDYGHYFTYACDSKRIWFKFNDSFVTLTTFEDFKSLEPPDTPYILFYAKTPSAEGIYEEEKPELSTLSRHLQDLVTNDTTAHIDELRHQADRKQRQPGRLSTPILRRHDNSDDENPPPSSCRGAVDIPANRFLF